MTAPIESIADAAEAETDEDIDPSLASVILMAIEGRLAELHTGLPAKVVTFDAAKGSCSVQPLLRRVIRDENEAARELVMPVIANVPIIYPGGGEWSMTFPLAVGDIVFLAFAERSLDEWLDAEPGVLVTPGQARKHDLSDAVAITQIRPRTSPIANIDTQNLRIQNTAGTVMIELTPDMARVKAPNIVLDAGAAADQAMVLGDILQTVLAALTVPTPLGPSGPPLNASTFPTFKSANAKVK